MFHKQAEECLIMLKTQGAADCFRFDKARTASLLKVQLQYPLIYVDLFILAVLFRVLVISAKRIGT